MPIWKQWPFYPGFVAIVLLAVLYAIVPSYRYFWDALIDCHNIEKAFDPQNLIHPTHPLFPLIFYNGFRMFIADIDGKAIHMLRACSTLFSILGLVAFFLILRRITGSYFSSGLAVLCTGLTSVWWSHSVSGNAFIISVAFLLLSLYTYTLRDKHRSGTLMTVLHWVFFAMAVLFQRFTLFFIIPFAFAEYSRCFDYFKNVGPAIFNTVIYFIVLVLFAVVPFILIPVLGLGIKTGTEWWTWWSGYDGALPYFTGGFEKSFRGLFTAGLGSITALPRSANVSFRHYEGAPPNVVAGLYYIVLVIISVGIFIAIKMSSKDDNKLSSIERTYSAFNISALIIVGVVCTVLHPYSLSHRLFLIPVVIGILTPWLHRLMANKPLKIQLLWLIIPIALFCNNWVVKFNNDRHINNNPYIYGATKAAGVIQPDELLIDTGVDEGLFRHAYMLYFTDINSRHFFDLPGVEEEDAAAYREELMKYAASGRRIIIHEDAIQSDKAMLTLLMGMGSQMSLEAYLEFVVQPVEPREYYIINAKKYIVVEVIGK